MMIRGICIALITAACSMNVAVDQQTVVYGKYYLKDRSGKQTLHNSYIMFRPQVQNSQGKLPVIIHFHGGGFTRKGPFTHIDYHIQQAINNGIAFISVGYRLIATKYYYDDDKVEELIHVDADGRLTIDTSGKTMDDYQVRRTRQEHTTKCSYDAAQMIEHLIAHADEYQIDMHRITFFGESAGGGEMHYLTWVYHQWNVGRYTPKGMVYDNAQLDYPVENILDFVWKIWIDDVGEGTLLSSLIPEKDCRAIVGNQYCESSSSGGRQPGGHHPDGRQPGDRRSGGRQHGGRHPGGRQPGDRQPLVPYNLCNETYTSQNLGRFCGCSFKDVTLGQLHDACVWPTEDPEVGKGMEVLWRNSLNMQKHQPKPFYLYVRNDKNDTDALSVVHNAMYARNYAKYAGMAGINYTVYYPDYHGMTEEDVGDRRFTTASGETVFNYRSSHDWANQPGFEGQEAGSKEEAILYHCFALGVHCSVTPQKASCEEEVDRICSTKLSDLDCANCIRAQTKRLIDAGCPSKKVESLIVACPSADIRFI